MCIRDRLSADDFRGTAGESLVPASAPTVHRVRYGREFPIVGARRIRWCAPEGYTAVSALAGNNEIRSSSNSHLLQIIEPLTDDVEIDIVCLLYTSSWLTRLKFRIIM